MAGGKETDCRVTVIAVPQRIDLNATQMTLTKGERATLIGTVFPANANDRNVYYYADGSSVVMVGERTGEVYANKLGTAVITAKNISSGITATCSVTVVAAGPAGIILEQNSITVGDAASQDIRVPLQLVNTDGSTLQATDDADWIGTSSLTPHTILWTQFYSKGYNGESCASWLMSAMNGDIHNHGLELFTQGIPVLTDSPSAEE